MTSAEHMMNEEEYTKPALSLLRKALKGNGVRPADITIKSFDGGTVEFMAATHIQQNNQISEKTVPGKADGSNIHQTRQAAMQEAERYTSSAFQNPATVKQIKDLISKKPHHGFAYDGDAVKLSFLDREFTTYEACAPCHGHGRIQCAKCKGHGHTPCTHCHAEGFEKCHECHGNRQIRDAQGGMQTCHLCQGLGKISCSFCKEHRQVQCSICQTKGETQCKSCSGQGAQSHIISAEISAQCSYDFDAGALPEKAETMVRGLGSKLADQAAITPMPIDAENDDQDILRLFFKVNVPQGCVDFSIKDKVVSAYLFGDKDIIKDIPDFLDSILAPGIQNLAKAANGEGNIGENIRGAVKYKTIRQAVMFTARYHSKKALKALLHYTPIGLSNQVARTLIHDANAALNHATKQQRVMAMAYGGGGSIVLGLAYYLSPARAAVLSLIENPALHMPVNLLAIGLCAAAGYGIWQSMSSRARKQALQSLMPPKSSK